MLSPLSPPSRRRRPSTLATMFPGPDAAVFPLSIRSQSDLPPPRQSTIFLGSSTKSTIPTGFHVPLWVLMLTLPVLALVMVGISTLVISYHRSQTTIDDISKHSRSLTCTVVENKIIALIGSLKSSVTHLSEYVRTSNMSADDPYPVDVRKSMFYLFHMNPALTSLFVGLNTSDSLQVARISWLFSNKNTRKSNNSSVYYLHSNYAQGWDDESWQQGMKNGTITATAYDATQRVWYKAAASQNDIILPPVYASVHPLGPELTQPVAIPIRDKNNQVRAVVGAGLALAEFDTFLSQILEELMPKTVLFLVEKETGFLLSSSIEGEHVAKLIDGASGQVMRTLATDAKDGTLRNLARSVEKSLGGGKGWAAIPLHDRDFSVSTSEYLINVRTVDMPMKGIQWVLVVGTNKNVWMSTVNDGLVVTIAIVVAIIVGFSIVIVILSRLITLPLRRVIRDISLLSSMDVDNVPQIPSSKFTEIAHLVHSINALTIHLREYRKFLPELLFAATDVEPSGVEETFHNDDIEAIPSVQQEQNEARGHIQRLQSFVPASSMPEIPTTVMSVENMPSPRNPDTPSHQVPVMSPHRGSGLRRFGSQRQLAVGFTGLPAPDNMSAEMPNDASTRLATVLCADLSNFESIASLLTFEQICSLHSQYLTLVHDCVSLHHGKMDKIMGDRIFAIWNVPRRCPRAELHAVQAAMEIISQFSTVMPRDRFPSSPQSSPLSTRRSVSLAATPRVGTYNNPSPRINPQRRGVRIGIASSSVRFGFLGNDTLRFFSVLGPAIGQAVILEKLACKIANTDVLISESIARQVSHQILCIPSLVLRLPSAMALPCYRPIEEINSDDKNDEWMYTLQSVEAQGEDLQSLFAKYCRHVREGSQMVPPPVSPRGPCNAGSELRNIIMRFPSGLEVPHMF